MINDPISNRLERLLMETSTERLDVGSRFVIFSDLRLGDGGVNDDFRRNAEMFQVMLPGYYLPGGHHRVLNGDI